MIQKKIMMQKKIIILKSTKNIEYGINIYCIQSIIVRAHYYILLNENGHLISYIIKKMLLFQKKQSNHPINCIKKIIEMKFYLPLIFM
jgi:hypothetical protein